MPLIVEGLCTTLNVDGGVNVAPMGPIVDPQLTTLHFRPFQDSTTFLNLSRTKSGVFHITDDILLIARAAVNRLSELPGFLAPEVVEGAVIADCCRWYEFEVVSIDDTSERTEIRTRIVHAGSLREFFGFNRAKHGILELAISATRLHLLEPAVVKSQLTYWEAVVEKTGGDAEHLAFKELSEFIRRGQP